MKKLDDKHVSHHKQITMILGEKKNPKGKKKRGFKLEDKDLAQFELEDE